MPIEGDVPKKLKSLSGWKKTEKFSISNSNSSPKTHLSVRCRFLFVISVQSIRQVPRVGSQLNEIQQIKANRNFQSIILAGVAINDEASIENLLRVDFKLRSVHREIRKHFVEKIHGHVTLRQRLSDGFE
jgi:hypothetical protein